MGENKENKRIEFLGKLHKRVYRKKDKEYSSFYIHLLKAVLEEHTEELEKLKGKVVKVVIEYKDEQ